MWWTPVCLSLAFGTFLLGSVVTGSMFLVWVAFIPLVLLLLCVINIWVILLIDFSARKQKVGRGAYKVSITRKGWKFSQLELIDEGSKLRRLRPDVDRDIRLTRRGYILTCW